MTPPDNKDVLKACPFCGTKPIFGWNGTEEGGYHYVECQVCSGSAGVPFCGVHADDPDETVEIWNRRASPYQHVGVEVPTEGGFWWSSQLDVFERPYNTRPFEVELRGRGIFVWVQGEWQSIEMFKWGKWTGPILPPDGEMKPRVEGL